MYFLLDFAMQRDSENWNKLARERRKRERWDL